jgi:hypothetical protein
VSSLPTPSTARDVLPLTSVRATMPGGILSVKPHGIDGSVSMVRVPTSAVLERMHDLVAHVARTEGSGAAAGRRLGLKQPQVSKILGRKRTGASGESIAAVIRKTGIDPAFFFAPRVDVSKWEEWLRGRPTAERSPSLVEFLDHMRLEPAVSDAETAWLEATPYELAATGYYEVLKAARAGSRDHLMVTRIRSKSA